MNKLSQSQKHHVATARRSVQQPKPAKQEQAAPYRARWGHDMSCDICSNRATTVRHTRSGIRFDICSACAEKLINGETLTDRWGFTFQLMDDRLQCMHPKCKKQEDSNALQ